MGQKGGHAYIWAPVGSRPQMVRDNRHVSTYIFGAICPDRAVGAAMIMPYANTEAMNIHLKEISAEVTPGAHAMLVCDGAGWHQRGGKLIVPDNITLITLPAYSPELNPMENVWDYLRQNKLCALVWETYDQILDACQSAWRFLSTIQTASDPSKRVNGRVSIFRWVGIRKDMARPAISIYHLDLITAHGCELSPQNSNKTWTPCCPNAGSKSPKK